MYPLGRMRPSAWEALCPACSSRVPVLWPWFHLLCSTAQIPAGRGGGRHTRR